MTTRNVRIVRLAAPLILSMAGCTGSDQSPQAPAATDAGGCGWSAFMDAVAAAPGNHRVLLENDRVRVLEVTVNPGEREPLHAHCLPGVEYAMSGASIGTMAARANCYRKARTRPNRFQ